MGLKIPIVALTANVMVNERESYKANGMNDVLGKPFTSQELWHCLLKYLTPVNKSTLKVKSKETPKPVNKDTNGLIEIQKNESVDRDNFDEEIRMQLLADFYNENKTKYREITGAIDVGDIKLAHRLVHTLKGNAGVFQKNRLRDAAAEAELHLTDEKNTLTAMHLNILEIELNAVLKELEWFFASSESSKKA